MPLGQKQEVAPRPHFLMRPRSTRSSGLNQRDGVQEARGPRHRPSGRSQTLLLRLSRYQTKSRAYTRVARLAEAQITMFPSRWICACGRERLGGVVQGRHGRCPTLSPHSQDGRAKVLSSVSGIRARSR